MTKQQTTGTKQRIYRGRVLVMLGIAALLADLAALLEPLGQLLLAAKGGLYSFVPAAGLSFLNVVRAVAFHQVDYFSLVCRILVLSSALVAVVVGTALWSQRRAPGTELDGPSKPASGDGDC